jgi:predicted alpha-1,6-mannanase (GH76 family)
MAEDAIYARHLRRLWAVPGTLLGVSGWPASRNQRLFGPWNYWWQAHVLDCMVDAYLRSPDERRRSAIEQLVNGINLRNGCSWRNDYYDDMAWLALALARAEQYAGVRREGAVPGLTARLRAGWTDHSDGGIWWRRREQYREDFKNVPTNGPAAILMARRPDQPDQSDRPEDQDDSDRQQARRTADWIEKHLIDTGTGLVYDGLHVRDDGGVRGVETSIYTYCQGVFIGACVELAIKDGHADEDADLWARRAVRTIDAVADYVTVPDEQGPVLIGQGGHDGGLFAGILARYLALAATTLPTLGAQYAAAAQLATDLVFSSAEAAWRNQTPAPGGPMFGPDWSKPAVLPGRGGGQAERDLSVQAGAWMLLEAAAGLERSGIDPPPHRPRGN